MKKSLNAIITSLFAVLTVLAITSGVSAQKKISVKPKPKPVVVKTIPVIVILPTRAEVEGMVFNLEENMDGFVDMLDKSLDHSSIDGTDLERDLNHRAKDLEKATDELRDRFKHSEGWQENKAQVYQCLSLASFINKSMMIYNFGYKTEARWVNIRHELNRLADAYGLPKVGSTSYSGSSSFSDSYQ